MAVQRDVIEDGSNQDVENFIFFNQLTELDSVCLEEKWPLTTLYRNSRHTYTAVQACETSRCLAAARAVCSHTLHKAQFNFLCVINRVARSFGPYVLYHPQTHRRSFAPTSRHADWQRSGDWMWKCDTAQHLGVLQETGCVFGFCLTPACFCSVYYHALLPCGPLGPGLLLNLPVNQDWKSTSLAADFFVYYLHKLKWVELTALKAFFLLLFA